jgi:hypothetical protein
MEAKRASCACTGSNLGFSRGLALALASSAQATISISILFISTFSFFRKLFL